MRKAYALGLADWWCFEDTLTHTHSHTHTHTLTSPCAMMTSGGGSVRPRPRQSLGRYCTQRHTYTHMGSPHTFTCPRILRRRLCFLSCAGRDLCMCACHQLNLRLCVYVCVRRAYMAPLRTFHALSIVPFLSPLLNHMLVLSYCSVLIGWLLGVSPYTRSKGCKSSCGRGHAMKANRANRGTQNPAHTHTHTHTHKQNMQVHMQ